MMGVVTLPAKQHNLLVHKAPRMQANIKTLPNPRGRWGRSGEEAKGEENKGRGYAQSLEGRIDGWKLLGEAIGASSSVEGEEW